MSLVNESLQEWPPSWLLTSTTQSKDKLAKAYERTLSWGGWFMNLRGQIRTLSCYRTITRADCWGGYRWGCLGAVSCDYNYSDPAAKSQHCWVHPRPARTKLSWLTRGVCQVSPAAVLNIVWIVLAILWRPGQDRPCLCRVQGWCRCDHCSGQWAEGWHLPLQSLHAGILQCCSATDQYH